MRKGHGILKAFALVIIFGGLGLLQACVKYDNATICGATLATYAIPGAGGYTQHNKPLIKSIERDSYGRELYRFQTKDDYKINALFITQKSDTKYIYYYDDTCYICLSDSETSEDEAIEELKQRNDWNESLDDSKMTKRVLNSKTDLFPQIEFENFNQCKTAFEEIVNMPDGCNVWFQASDVSKTGQELYLASVFRVDSSSENSVMAWQKHYLMIFSADGTYDPEKFIVSFDDLYKSNQPLTEVKEQNNWQN